MWPPFDCHSVIRRLHDVVNIADNLRTIPKIHIKKVFSQRDNFLIVVSQQFT